MLSSAELSQPSRWGGRCGCLYLCIEPALQEHPVPGSGCSEHHHLMSSGLSEVFPRNQMLPQPFPLFSVLAVVSARAHAGGNQAAVTNLPRSQRKRRAHWLSSSSTHPSPRCDVWSEGREGAHKSPGAPTASASPGSAGFSLSWGCGSRRAAGTCCKALEEAKPRLAAATSLNYRSQDCCGERRALGCASPAAGR